MTRPLKSSGTLLTVIIFTILLLYPKASPAQYGWLDPGPSRIGFAGSWGRTFDPVSDIDIFQLTGMAIWDYDPIWRSWGPKFLKFKLEASAGAADTLGTRAVFSVAMSGLYYPDFLSANRLRTYLEGGLGVIYTDFQVKDPDPPYDRQGLRFNFNPIIGIGVEFKQRPGASYFASFRLSHLSNVGLKSDNRGVNSIVFLVGRLWDIRF